MADHSADLYGWLSRWNRHSFVLQIVRTMGAWLLDRADGARLRSTGDEQDLQPVPGEHDAVQLAESEGGQVRHRRGAGRGIDPGRAEPARYAVQPADDLRRRGRVQRALPRGPRGRRLLRLPARAV